MRHAARRRCFVWLTLPLFVASCVSTQLPPISYSGSGFQPLPDEQELWAEARSEEDQLLSKVDLYGDPLLEAYLERIVARINPPGMADNSAVYYRVKVIEDPTLNAFAYPHGAIYVHTGLLARMENEAELATIFGHEMTHVENRHMLRYQRQAHNREIGLTVAAVAAAVVAEVAADNAFDAGHYGRAATLDVVSDLILSLGLQLAFVAAVNGYGRGLEVEADEGGFAKLSAAGYDLAQAPKVYEALLEDLGEPRKAEAFFFGSHPRLSERIASTRQYVSQHPASTSPAGVGDESEFARRLQPVVRDDARINIERGRLELAAAELAKAGEGMPRAPEVHFLAARLRLAQASTEQDPDTLSRLHREAAAAFSEAIRLDPGHPAPHRELGLLYYQDKNFPAACRELRAYRKLVGDDDDSEDADRIRDDLRELEREGHCGPQPQTASPPR
jgi:predicted Zn-dependent protease